MGSTVPQFGYVGYLSWSMVLFLCEKSCFSEKICPVLFFLLTICYCLENSVSDWQIQNFSGCFQFGLVSKLVEMETLHENQLMAWDLAQG